MSILGVQITPKYKKMPITHAEFEPKNPKLKKKKRRLPARNLNQKHPLLKIEVGFFSDKKSFSLNG